MKKLAKYLAMIVLVAMLLSTMASCSTQEEDYRVKNPTEAPSVATLNPDWTSDWTSVPQPTDANGVELPGDPYHYINPERLFNIGEWMDIAGVKVRLNSVTFTKKLGDMNLKCMVPNGAYWRNMIDEEGNIYGNESYVIMNIDVQNQTEEAVKICLANFSLSEQVLTERYGVTNFRYIEPSMYAEPNSGYYLVQPGEEITFQHYSVIEDSNIDDEVLYFHIPSYAIDISIEADDWYYGYAVWVPINKDKSEVDVYDTEATTYNEKDFINPERIYNIGETAEMKGMSFRVNEVNMTKELEGISMDRIRYGHFEKSIIDSNGTFLDGEYTRDYIRANVTIKNLTEEEKKLCTSVIYMVAPYSGGISYDGYSGYSSGVTPSTTTDLYYADFYTFQPGEEVTVDLYYFGLDWENKLIQFPLNMGLQDEDNPESSYDYDIFVSLKKDKNEVNIYGEGEE